MAITTLKETTTDCVGIDISKQRLACWLRPAGQHLCCSNAPSGFQDLHRWLIRQGCERESTIVCLENTGIYGKRLLRDLTCRGWRCAMEKTTVLHKVGPEHHRKNDVFDARLLAEYAERVTDRLHLSRPAAPNIDRMQQLYAERRRLVRQRTATKTKQTQSEQQPHCPELLQEAWRQQLALLDRQIAALDWKIGSRR